MSAVICVKSDSLPDWYAIEKAEHENRHWMEPYQSEHGYSGMAMRYSGRISDADVEGTSEEMLAIASAIKQRKSISFRRCAADFTERGYQMYSPRNSQAPALITLDEADALAESITKVIAGVS